MDQLIGAKIVFKQRSRFRIITGIVGSTWVGENAMNIFVLAWLHTTIKLSLLNWILFIWPEV